MDDALDLAREGVTNNPRSGLLRANYVQLLLIQGRKGDLPLMLEQARVGLGSNTEYGSVDDAFEALWHLPRSFQVDWRHSYREGHRRHEGRRCANRVPLPPSTGRATGPDRCLDEFRNHRGRARVRADDLGRKIGETC